MQHECLKCFKTVDLPDGHKFNVCPHCGAIQEKVRAALDAKQSVREPPLAATEDNATPVQPSHESPLMACPTCGHQMARRAVACPSCGAPNELITVPKVSKPQQIWGAIALLSAVAAIFMPYFASVFFTPLAAVFALIAMAREQVAAGLVALGLSAIALNGIWNTSQKIDAARTMLEQSQRDVQRSQEDFERKMRELRSKLN